MAGSNKSAWCEGCGVKLPFKHRAFQRDSCGEDECEDALREMGLEDDERRQEAAREDDYGRY